MPEIKSDRPTYASDFFKGDTDQAVFTGDAVTDRIMHAVIALGGEVWSLRQRGHVMEKFLAEKGITSEMIESYMPTKEDTAAWQEDREAFVDRVYSVFARDSKLKMTSDWPAG